MRGSFQRKGMSCSGIKLTKHLLELEVHLLVEEALYKLVHNQDIGMDTVQNHSTDNTDNTVDKQALAVEWWM